MISGFVIFTSSRNRTASQFLVARAVRLYPAFLSCALLTGLIIFLFGAPTSHVTLRQLIANFSMLAPAFNEKHLDASYWTLGVELKFYAMIFFLILFGFSRHLEKVFLVWGTVILAASIGNFNALPALSGYSSYFCAGSLFAMRMEKKSWPLNVLLTACLYYSLHFSCIESPQIKEVHLLSPEVLAAIVCTFYIFFWSISSGKLTGLNLPGARELGMVTYPLYLIHQSIGYILISRFATEQNKIMAISASMISMVLLGFLIHYYFEVKPSRIWKSFFRFSLGQPAIWLETRIDKIRTRLKIFAIHTW